MVAGRHRGRRGDDGVVGEGASAGGRPGLTRRRFEQVRPPEAAQVDLRPRVGVVARHVVGAVGGLRSRGEADRDACGDAERTRHHRVRAGELHAEPVLGAEELEDGGAVVEAPHGGVVDEVGAPEVVAQRRRLRVRRGRAGVGDDLFARSDGSDRCRRCSGARCRAARSDGTGAAVAAICSALNCVPASGGSAEWTVYFRWLTADASATMVPDERTTSVSGRSMATGRYAAGSHRSDNGPIRNSWRRRARGCGRRQPDAHAAVALRAERPLAAVVARVLVEGGDPPVVGERGPHGEQLRVVDVVELAADVDERRERRPVAAPAGVAPPGAGDVEQRVGAGARDDRRDHEREHDRATTEQGRGRQPVRVRGVL